MKGHDCEKVLSKVFLALDGELSPTEERTFFSEIENCSCCLEKFEIEESFKQFLSGKIKRHEASEQFARRIRGKIDQMRENSRIPLR